MGLLSPILLVTSHLMTGIGLTLIIAVVVVYFSLASADAQFYDM